MKSARHFAISTLVLSFAFGCSKKEPEPTAAPVDDKKKAKDTKKDAKDAKTPPPSGQAGIPGRSKEKVEDAMQKSEDRVEGSPGAERVKGGM